ncbi:MAG: DUF2341 domain-containing protein, partial [Candidatus Diapherotrites archaeon]|nr:DUF2341 domain-containing protein [Candidatus Diapherotrites archaeon]
KYTPNIPTHTISAPVVLDWQLGDWGYRKHINITGSPDGDLTDFQISMDVDYELGMNSDFSDLRFKTIGGEDVSYWVEEKTDELSAKVWFNLPQIFSETGTDVWIYYGNSEAASLSNPNAVFDLFDDFEGPTLNTSKWAVVGSSGSMSFANSEMIVRPTTAYKSPYGIRSLSTYSSGTVVETKGKNTANRHVAMVGLAESPWMQFPHGDTVTDGFAMYSRVDGSDYVTASYGYGSNTGGGPAQSTNTSYYTWKIEFVSPTLVRFYRNDALKHTLSNPAYITPNPLNAYLTGDNYYGRGTVVVYDWIRVYKITANEPSLSIGMQEQGTAPFVTNISFDP